MEKNFSADVTKKPIDPMLDQFIDPTKLDTYEESESSEFAEVEVVSESALVETTSPGKSYQIGVVDKTPEVDKTVDAVVSVIEEYNVKYGVELPTTIDDIRSIITEIASKSQRDLYSVVLSEVADRIILATTGSLLVTISSMVQELSLKQGSGTMELPARIAIMDRFMIYIEKLLDIRDRLAVDNPRIAIEAAKRNNKYEESGTRENIDIEKIDNIIDILKNRGE